jgi:hypothetical protein
MPPHLKVLQSFRFDAICSMKLTVVCTRLYNLAYEVQFLARRLHSLLDPDVQITGGAQR